MSSTTSSDENNAAEPAEATKTPLYTTSILVFTRDFKGQSSGAQVAKWTIFSDSLDEFIELLWLKVKPFIRAEIVMVDEKLEWGSLELKSSDLNK